MKRFALFALMAVQSLQDQLHPPARLRVNTELIQTIFHAGDQRLLTTFQDMQLKEPIEKTKEDSDETWGLQSLKASIQPVSGSMDNYDFELALKDPNQNDFFGIKGNNLKITGHVVKLDGSSFDFEGAFSSFKFNIDEKPEDDPRILQMKEEAVKYEKGDFDIQFDKLYQDGDEFKCPCLENLIKEQVENMIREEYSRIWSGDKESLVHLPVESLLPILILKNLGSLSTSFTLEPSKLDYGFDPDLLFLKKIPAKKAAMLKEIDSQFIEVAEGGDQQALQLVLDENLINKYLLEFVMMDQSMSLTKWLQMDPRFAPMINSLNSKVVFEHILPDIAQKYGSKRFDVLMSLSHNLLKSQLDGARVTGFSQDKNGNFRFTFNIYGQILIDTTGNKDYKSVREVFLGLAYKGKFVVKEDRPGEKKLLIVSKSAEVSNVKILQEEGEESVVEQMMITSFMNVQFEQMISAMPPYEFSLKNPPSPKEIECLGFKLSDVTLDFKKGYMQLGCGYKKVNVPSDPQTCEQFLDVLRNGPNEAMKMAYNMMNNPDEMNDFLHTMKDDSTQEEEVNLDEPSHEQKIITEEL